MNLREGFGLLFLLWLYNEAFIDQSVWSTWEKMQALVFHMDLLICTSKLQSEWNSQLVNKSIALDIHATSRPSQTNYYLLHMKCHLTLKKLSFWELHPSHHFQHDLAVWNLLTLVSGHKLPCQTKNPWTETLLYCQSPPDKSPFEVEYSIPGTLF